MHNINAGQSKPTVSSYLLANNSYQTTITCPEPTISTNNNITTTRNQRPHTDRVGGTQLLFCINRILNVLPSNNNLGNTKAYCLSTSLLGITLAISVLNTLLLSFVVKSIQLDNRGFIYGKVSWDDQLDSTVFELPTRVAGGKSISMKSIETFADDKPLILEKLFDKEGGYTLNDIKQDQSSWKHREFSSPFSDQNQRRTGESIGKRGEFVFLTNADTISRQEGATDDDAALSKFNYLSVNVNDNHKENEQFAKDHLKPATLQMRTNLLVFNQLIENQTNLEDLSSKLSLSFLADPAHQLTTMMLSSSDLVDGDKSDKPEEEVKKLSEVKNGDINIKPLLILNAEQQSVTLPSESRLFTLNPSFTSGSIILDEQLRSSEVTGSLEEDFNIQTRDRNLVCKSKDTMKLMSRSAGIRITTLKELTLRAPSLGLKSANNLYIQNGVEYFDSLQQDDDDFQSNKVDSHDNNNFLRRKSDVAQTNYHYNQRGIANGKEGNNYALRAYNLVVADGILMAMA